MSSVFDNGGIIGQTMDFASTEPYASRNPFSTEFLSLVEINAPGTTSTSFSVSTTGLTTNDTLVVVYGAEVTNLSSSDWVTSITVGGQFATIDEQIGGGNSGNGVVVCIAHISGISGDSQTIVVNYPSRGTIYRNYVANYRLIGCSNVMIAETDTANLGLSGGSSVVLSTQAYKGGCCIYGNISGDASDTVTWSSATETYDKTHNESNASISGGYLSVVTDAVEDQTITLSGWNSRGVFCAVSYYDAVFGNYKNSGIWKLQSVYRSKRYQ